MSLLLNTAMKAQAVCQYMHDNRRSNIKYSCMTCGEKQNKKSFRTEMNRRLHKYLKKQQYTFQWKSGLGFFASLLFWLSSGEYFLSTMPCFLSNERCWKFLKAFCKERVCWQQWWISLVTHTTQPHFQI